MQLFASTQTRGLLPLDPRTKLVLVVVVNIAVLTRPEPQATLLAFVCAAGLLASIGSWRIASVQILLFGLCQAVRLVSLYVLDGPGWQMAGAAGFFLANLVTVLTIGVYLVRSTTPSELIEALRRLHAPPSLWIPLAVMLRFFPTLLEELTAVVQAVRLRDLHSSQWDYLRHPLVSVEHIMVPFLVSATRIGDELAASALTRGLGGSTRRTSITTVRFRSPDLVGLAMAGLILVVFLKELLG